MMTLENLTWKATLRALIQIGAEDVVLRVFDMMIPYLQEMAEKTDTNIDDVLLEAISKALEQELKSRH